MRIGRWLAIAERYSSFPFVTPFEDDDGYIGASVFEEMGREQGFDVRPAKPGSGILESLDRIDGSTFASAGAHRLVRRLYEATTTMDFLDERIEFKGLGRAMHWVVRRVFSGPSQQLGVPDTTDLPDVISAAVLELDVDHDQVPDYRVWVRTFGKGNVFYVGTVGTHRDRRAGVEIAYLTVSLPLYRANLAFVFQPFALDGGGLSLRTRGGPGSDAGVYLIFPGPERFGLVRVPFLTDEIQITALDEGSLRAIQRNRMPGGGFDMRYTLRPKADR